MVLVVDSQGHSFSWMSEGKAECMCVAAVPTGGASWWLVEGGGGGSVPSRDSWSPCRRILVGRHPCLRDGLFSSHQQRPGGRNPGLCVKELKKKFLLP